jgi:hypothetical protein
MRLGAFVAFRRGARFVAAGVFFGNRVLRFAEISTLSAFGHPVAAAAANRTKTGDHAIN